MGRVGIFTDCPSPNPVEVNLTLVISSMFVGGRTKVGINNADAEFHLFTLVPYYYIILCTMKLIHFSGIWSFSQEGSPYLSFPICKIGAAPPRVLETCEASFTEYYKILSGR